MFVRVKYPTKRGLKNAKQANELKRKVRKSQEWKELRTVIYDRQDGKDVITGQPLRSGWQVHHLREHPDYYDVLVPENFIGINRTTHSYLHWRIDYGDKLEVESFDKYLKIMNEWRKTDYF